MRRKELINALLHIHQAIGESNILEHLHAQVRHLRKKGSAAPDVGELLASLNYFSIKTSGFSKNEKRVLAILELDALHNPKVWPKLISHEYSDLIVSCYSNVRRLSRYLVSFQKLIAEGHHELSAIEQESSILSILLLPNDSQQDTPNKIASMLQGVQLLYESLAALEEQAVEEPLILLACDSGRDKSFDFQGDPQTLDKMRELLFGVWARVMHFNDDYMSEQLSLTLKTLPILEQVDLRANNDLLEKEKAALLKRNIAKAVNILIRSSVILEEMYEEAKHANGFSSQLTPRISSQSEPAKAEDSIVEATDTEMQYIRREVSNDAQTEKESDQIEDTSSEQSSSEQVSEASSKKSEDDSISTQNLSILSEAEKKRILERSNKTG